MFCTNNVSLVALKENEALLVVEGSGKIFKSTIYRKRTRSSSPETNQEDAAKPEPLLIRYL